MVKYYGIRMLSLAQYLIGRKNELLVQRKIAKLAKSQNLPSSDAMAFFRKKLPQTSPLVKQDVESAIAKIIDQNIKRNFDPAVKTLVEMLSSAGLEEKTRLELYDVLNTALEKRPDKIFPIVTSFLAADFLSASEAPRLAKFYQRNVTFYADEALKHIPNAIAAALRRQAAAPKNSEWEAAAGDLLLTIFTSKKNSPSAALKAAAETLQKTQMFALPLVVQTRLTRVIVHGLDGVNLYTRGLAMEVARPFIPQKSEEERTFIKLPSSCSNLLQDAWYKAEKSEVGMYREQKVADRASSIFRNNHQRPAPHQPQ